MVRFVSDAPEDGGQVSPDMADEPVKASDVAPINDRQVPEGTRPPLAKWYRHSAGTLRAPEDRIAAQSGAMTILGGDNITVVGGVQSKTVNHDQQSLSMFGWKCIQNAETKAITFYSWDGTSWSVGGGADFYQKSDAAGHTTEYGHD